MIDTAFNGVDCDLQRWRNRAERAENLNERDVEIAQAGLRRLLAAIVLLRLGRRIALQMPNVVSKRAVLRHEQ